MFHGLGAHINHGAHIARDLTKIGCIVVGFDHRGKIYNFQKILKVLEKVREQEDI